jgi:hypothetical protein
LTGSAFTDSRPAKELASGCFLALVRSDGIGGLFNGHRKT